MQSLEELKRKLEEMRKQQEEIYRQNLEELTKSLLAYNEGLLKKLRADLEQHEKELRKSLKRIFLLTSLTMIGAGIMIGTGAALVSYYTTKERISPEQAKMLQQGEWIPENNCLLLKNRKVLIYNEKKQQWTEKRTHICIQE